jgi:hypothetical protein
MSNNERIISDLILERLVSAGCSTSWFFESDEPSLISFYGGRMLKGIQSGKITKEQTDAEITKLISGGLLTWLFWSIASELLSWIIQEIRKRILEQTAGSESA